MYKILVTTIYKTWVSVTTLVFDTEKEADEALGSLMTRGDRIEIRYGEAFYREIVPLWRA